VGVKDISSALVGLVLFFGKLNQVKRLGIFRNKEKVNYGANWRIAP
jgi:hypothetical protein